MDCTVVVVPRERFRPLPDSLNSLFSTIGPEVPVVVVDGGAPDHIRRKLAMMQEKRNFEWVKSDRFIRPSRARNLGLQRSKSRFTVFCDNDLHYYEGWLSELVGRAETSGAAAVCPITLIGPSAPEVIHHAGGSSWLQKNAYGRIRLRSKHRFASETLDSIPREKMSDTSFVCHYFEYHCVLVDTRVMKTIGGSDERLMRLEHMDSSLRILAEGHIIAFEPKSKVMYNAYEKFESEDWPYFLFRWSADKSDETAETFANNWGLYEPKENEEAGFLQRHRERAISTLLPKLKGFPKRKFIRRVLLKIVIRPYVLRLERRVPDETEIVMLPRPSKLALERAGIGLSPRSTRVA